MTADLPHNYADENAGYAHLANAVGGGTQVIDTITVSLEQS